MHTAVKVAAVAGAAVALFLLFRPETPEEAAERSREESRQFYKDNPAMLPVLIASAIGNGGILLSVNTPRAGSFAAVTGPQQTVGAEYVTPSGVTVGRAIP